MIVDNPKEWGSHQRYECEDWTISPKGWLYFYRGSDEEECEHETPFLSIPPEGPEQVAVYEYPKRDSDLPLFLKVGLVT